MRELRLLTRFVLLVAATLFAACGARDSPTDPASDPTVDETTDPGGESGSAPETAPIVRTETTGSNLDADGYALIIDGRPGPAVGRTASVSLPALTAGSHSVGLHGLATNCQVSVPNPQTLVVGDPFFDPIVVFYVYCH